LRYLLLIFDHPEAKISHLERQKSDFYVIYNKVTFKTFHHVISLSIFLDLNPAVSLKVLRDIFILDCRNKKAELKGSA